MLKKVGYVATGVATSATISFGTEFLVNLLSKQWEIACLTGPTLATATGVGLYLRDIQPRFSIPMAIVGGALLGRNAYYVTRFQRQFEQGKRATLPPEVNSMRAIAQVLTPEEKGLKMPGMVKA